MLGGNNIQIATHTSINNNNTDPQQSNPSNNKNNNESNGNGRRKSIIGGSKATSKKDKRIFRQSNRENWILIAKISIVFLVSTAYFLTVFFQETNKVDTSVQGIPRIYWSGRRSSLARDMYIDLQELLVAPLIQSDVIPPNETVVYDRIEKTGEFLLSIQHGLLYGSSWMNTSASVGASSKMDALLFGDACKEVKSHTYEECVAFGDGVITHGVDSALEEYIRAVRSFAVQFMNQPNRTLSYVNETIHSVAYQRIKQMDATYFYEPMDAAEELVLNEQLDAIDAFTKSLALLLGLFLTALVLLFVVVYLPIVRSLDSQVKRTRGMLLMIPYDVMEHLPQLRKLLFESKI